MTCYSGTKKGKLVLYQMGSLFLSTYYLTPIMENFLSSVLHVPNTISSLFADFRATEIVVNDGVQCKGIFMMRAVSEEI